MSIELSVILGALLTVAALLAGLSWLARRSHGGLEDLNELCECGCRRALHAAPACFGLVTYYTDCRATGCDCRRFRRADPGAVFLSHTGETETEFTSRLRDFQSTFSIGAPDWNEVPSKYPGSCFPTLRHAFGVLLTLDYLETSFRGMKDVDQYEAIRLIASLRQDPTWFPPAVVVEYLRHVKLGWDAAKRGA